MTWLKVSYLENPKGWRRSVTLLAKANQRPNFVGDGRDTWILGTQADADLAVWAVKNHYAIASRVQVADPQTLVEVAKLVGFPLDGSTNV
jgi:hypothetical protein